MSNRVAAVWIVVFVAITGLIGFIEIGSEIASGTDVSGIVYDGSGGPWTPAGNPYIVVDSVIVPAGQTLTIEPGVEVRFDGHYDLFIDGNLSAIGNPINMIKFTSNSSFPSKGSWRKIYINSTGHAEMEYCNITYANEGIYLSSTQNNTITNNKIFSSNKGIYLNSASYNNITDNYISDCGAGIFLFSSSNNNISNNELLSNSWNGIQLSYSSNNILLNNQIQNSDLFNLYVLGSNKDQYNNTIPTSNTANGRPIYYFFDIQDEVIEYLDAGHITLAWCENVILRNSSVINGDAISLSYVMNSTVNYCNTSNSRYGILLSYSLYNNITYNNVTDNTYGVFLYYSSNNWVFKNNIVDHLIQAVDDPANNSWNRTYPIGGNYWSDYTGNDLFSGPNQDIPGSDGIGDTNYTTDIDSQDYYPLMLPILDAGVHYSKDLSPPVINLISPANNSIIKSGVTLDFNISDANLNEVYYSVNSNPNQTFYYPYDIHTDGWTDGTYMIEIYANDNSSNYNHSIYFFTIDSTSPSIILITPMNNSVIIPGTNINFTILDPNLKAVNYSINNGINLVLASPYNFDTIGWVEGNYTIEIRTEDIAGNNNTRWFQLFVDTTLPEIILFSPVNNSIIKPGTMLDFIIFDSNIDIINYSVNNSPYLPFNTPYDLNSTEWLDGQYTIRVYAMDLAGNNVTRSFIFQLDSQAPLIELNSPINNSIILPGTVLDFDVYDLNLNNTHFSINDGTEQSFASSYNISTDEWLDGEYTIKIYTGDLAGNNVTRSFVFTLDSQAPLIELNSPINNSIILQGTVLDFDVSDVNLYYTHYSINNGTELSFAPSYNISTNEWLDGEYTIKIYARDLAGNNVTRSFVFTLDSQVPLIELNSPLNNSIILQGAVLDFDVSDVNLNYTHYSINNGIEQSFTSSYNISTNEWLDGMYIIEIYARDEAGNEIIEWYRFIIDGTSPALLQISITDINYPFTNITIIINFTESMNKTSVESVILITPEFNYAIQWNNNNETVILTDIFGLTYNISYTIKLIEGSKDLVGNVMINSSSIIFYTLINDALDTDNDGMSDFWEIQFGLDPNNPIDANTDLDNDGHTNLAEYKANTDPLDPESKPVFKKKTSSILDYLWVIIISAIAIILVLVVVFIRKRRREQQNSYAEALPQKNIDDEVIWKTEPSDNEKIFPPHPPQS